MKFTRYCIAAACAAVLAGCQDNPTTAPGFPGGAVTSSSPSAASAIREEEAELHRLASQIPGFGGYYFDQNGDMIAYLADLGRAEQARAVLQPILAKAPGVPRSGGRVLLRQGRYTFPELAAWRDRITDPVLELEGVRSVDAQEARNRVVVGIAGPAVQGRVERVLADLGVPREAVTMEVTEELTLDMSPEETLLSTSSSDSITGWNRPLRGGIRIGRWTDRANGKISRCTLGAIVRRDGLNLSLTASHCSEKSWEDDFTVFYQPQPDYNDYNRIGVEYDDKQGSSCGFLSVNVCRYSDATLVRTDAGIGDELGRIARTRFSASSVVPDTLGSLEIDPAVPYFQIVGRTTVSVGTTVQKMGARTGWTRGGVTATCVDTNAQRSYSKLRCQVETKTWVSPGDSGGPAFLLNSDGTVYLLGIFWGRKKDGSYHYYSPLSGVEKDLGALVTN